MDGVFFGVDEVISNRNENVNCSVSDVFQYNDIYSPANRYVWCMYSLTHNTCVTYTIK